jgi:hypothetical protein
MSVRESIRRAAASQQGLPCPCDMCVQRRRAAAEMYAAKMADIKARRAQREREASEWRAKLDAEWRANGTILAGYKARNDAAEATHDAALAKLGIDMPAVRAKMRAR